MTFLPEHVRTEKGRWRCCEKGGVGVWSPREVIQSGLTCPWVLLIVSRKTEEPTKHAGMHAIESPGWVTSAAWSVSRACNWPLNICIGYYW